MGLCPLCKKPSPSAKFCPDDGALLTAESVDGSADTTMLPPAAPVDPWLGQVVGNYRLASCLGVGGMGVVYRGEHVNLPKQAAIKLLQVELGIRPGLAERFHQEATAAASIGHPNIIEVIDFGQRQDGTLYLLMELLHGRNVRALFREGQLSPERLLTLLEPICLGLEAAHQRGIIHRDLKPENIFLAKLAGEEERVKLLDFGIAKLLHGSVHQTAEGALLGTPLYMSPEQASGRVVDLRSDIYSLGVLIYEALCGEVPFRAETAAAVMVKHVTARPKPPSEWVPSLSREIEALVLRCLEKSPEARPQRASELLALYREALAGNATTTPSTDSQEATFRRAERRPLTALCARLELLDMNGEELDPEELVELLPKLRASCAQIIQRFGGSIAKAEGEEIMAYFGYPLGYEDDAKRATQAALALQEELPRLPMPGCRLSLRQGLHSGLVVTEGQGASVIGDAVKLAPAIASFARRGEVILSSSAHRLVERYFSAEDRGPSSVGGKPLTLYKLQGARSFDTPFVSRTPIVGREQELALLLSRWEQAREGLGHSVLLVGEAGLGKSRLAQALWESVDEEGKRITCQGSPLHQSSAFYPIIEMMLRELLDREGSLQKLIELETRLKLSKESAKLFGALLSVPLPAGQAALELSPQRRKQKTLEAIVSLLTAMAAERPLLFIFEDVHWADPSTLELLGLLLEQLESAPILVLLTARPEFRSPWRTSQRQSLLGLSRLTKRQAEEVVRRAAGQTLPPEAVAQVLAKSDGIPLFVEELTRAAVELKGGESAIPDTLKGSLAARLDRLGRAKEVAQLASCIGREFSYELLRASSPMEAEVLEQALVTLCGAEILHRRGTSYLFKHALVQDAAYQSLVKGTRQALHLTLAQTLRERFPEIAGEQPEVLARHFEEAQKFEEAIEQLQLAGERAAKRFANKEAVIQFRRAITLLQELPETPSRIKRELSLQLSMGSALLIAEGYAFPEVGRIYHRAHELCRIQGNTPQFVPALFGLWLFYTLSGELKVALLFVEQLTAFAEASGATLSKLHAYRCHGSSLLFSGDSSGAISYLERALVLCELGEYNPKEFGPAADPEVFSRAFYSIALWLAGRSKEANEQKVLGLARARSLGHPLSLAFSLQFGAWLSHLLGQPEETCALANEMFIVSADQDAPYFISIANILQGWALYTMGREEGLPQLRDGFIVRQRISPGTKAFFLSVLVDGLQRAGLHEEALSLSQEELRCAEKTGEHFFDAELHRRNGLSLWALSREDEAETSFEEAISIAKQQTAKSLEARARLNLARLHLQRGNTQGAKQCLAPALSLSDDEESPTSKETKSLLASL